MLVRFLPVAVALVAVLGGCGSGRAEPVGTAVVVSAASVTGVVAVPSRSTGAAVGSAAGVPGPGGAAVGSATGGAASEAPRGWVPAETACLAATRKQVAAGRRSFSAGTTEDDASAYAKTSREAWIACATLTVMQARAIRDEAEREP
jgi:hypothetical protein